ncbi:MAG: UbiH/UbiF/VisC/COQ6 family ubiquinone biosynthesis hydroxylase [Gammaproteobacteria bacterium]|nr:UbiH/UbiF/VisC/COQ6 family ubiquinone biosynthesis hydroxylase [Gammaproteobacteria bacterium]
MNASKSDASLETDFDILINGGGMVGATLACALMQSASASQLKVGIVEGETLTPLQTEDWGIRVSAITLASQTLFESLAVWPLILANRASPFDGMSVWDAEGTGSIQFHARDLGEPTLGHIVENRVIQEALYQRLAELNFQHWFCPDKLVYCEPVAAGWQLELESGTRLTTRLLIGADGALSKVRELAQFKLASEAYGHSGIVTTIKTEKPNAGVARQRFLNSGPLAFLPLKGRSGDRHCCSIVWSLDTEKAEEMMALDDAAFALALGEASEFCLGKVESIGRRISFPFYERHAEQYVQEGVALCGDAAHTIHPLAGQGVNLGLMDAAVLAEELDRAVLRGADLGSTSILRRYERRRRGANSLMMHSMRGFKELFGTDQLALRWLRNTGMSWMNDVLPIKNKIMSHAMGLSGDLPRLARDRRL